eukprot:gene2768-5454_t
MSKGFTEFELMAAEWSKQQKKMENKESKPSTLSNKENSRLRSRSKEKKSKHHKRSRSRDNIPSHSRRRHSRDRSSSNTKKSHKRSRREPNPTYVNRAKESNEEVIGRDPVIRGRTRSRSDSLAPRDSGRRSRSLSRSWSRSRSRSPVAWTHDRYSKQSPRGLVWTVEMYRTGTCPDVGYTLSGRQSPTPQLLYEHLEQFVNGSGYIKSMTMTGEMSMDFLQAPSSPMGFLSAAATAACVIPVHFHSVHSVPKHLRSVWRAVQSRPLIKTMGGLGGGVGGDSSSSSTMDDSHSNNTNNNEDNDNNEGGGDINALNMSASVSVSVDITSYEDLLNDLTTVWKDEEEIIKLAPVDQTEAATTAGGGDGGDDLTSSRQGKTIRKTKFGDRLISKAKGKETVTMTVTETTRTVPITQRGEQNYPTTTTTNTTTRSTSITEDNKHNNNNNNNNNSSNNSNNNSNNNNNNNKISSLGPLMAPTNSNRGWTIVTSLRDYLTDLSYMNKQKTTTPTQQQEEGIRSQRVRLIPRHVKMPLTQVPSTIYCPSNVPRYIRVFRLEHIENS